MDNKNNVNKGRRELLKGLTTATVVSAAVVGTSKSVVASEPIAPAEKVKSEGYHETQHIRDYYDTL